MKVCTKCKVEKPFDLFAKCSKHADGLNYYCRICEKLRFKEYSLKNPEKTSASRKNWVRNNPEKRKAQKQRHYQKNKEKILKHQKEYIDKNFEMIAARKRAYVVRTSDKWREYFDKYWRENKDRVYARNGKRRAAKRQAVATWANLHKIQTIYERCIKLSEETGIQHHVDHIIPLTHRLVCGLHVEHNLQIITAVENSIKNNKFQPHVSY